MSFDNGFFKCVILHIIIIIVLAFCKTFFYYNLSFFFLQCVSETTVI